MKLLAIRLDAAGDVLMCSPALRALHEGGHRVTLLTSEAGALAGERIAGMAEVWTWAAPWMKGGASADADCVPRMATRLREAAFGGAVIFCSYSQSPLPAAMLCQMAGIPMRLAHCRENPYQLLTHWVKESEPVQQLRHEVQRQLDLVARLGCIPSSTRLSVRIDDSDVDRARNALRSVGIAADKPWLLLHPGASAPSRRYPAHGWRQVAHLLEHGIGLPFAFAGAAHELPLLREIIGAEGERWPSLAGMLDFGALAAAISMASVLVACNSAPAHLAAATGTPVVDLYALTNPQHAPWQVRQKLLFSPVPCAHCLQSVCPRERRACLDDVSAGRVIGAVQELLRGG